MASSKTILTLLFLTAVISSLGNLGETAYGDENIYDPGTGAGQPDEGLVDGDTGGLLSGLFSFLAGIIGGLVSFFGAFVPAPTGIWVIDSLIINPLIAFGGYIALKVGLGVVN